MNLLDQDYWDARWKTGETGWDIGYASPALMDFMRNQNKSDIRILIPGCGNAYEAEALREMGFTNIVLLDISPKVCEIMRERFKDKKGIRVLCEDFFNHDSSYDLILEQTFFCALDPGLREAYAEKMHQLLKPSGTLAGLLFRIKFDQPGPPFGGEKEEYLELFESRFEIVKMIPCDRSIPQRLGNELWMELKRKEMH